MKQPDTYPSPGRHTDAYLPPTELKLNGCTAKIYHPDLSDEERLKRQKDLEEATKRFMLEVLQGRKRRAGSCEDK